MIDRRRRRLCAVGFAVQGDSGTCLFRRLHAMHDVVGCFEKECFQGFTLFNLMTYVVEAVDLLYSLQQLADSFFIFFKAMVIQGMI